MIFLSYFHLFVVLVLSFRDSLSHPAIHHNTENSHKETWHALIPHAIWFIQLHLSWVSLLLLRRHSRCRSHCCRPIQSREIPLRLVCRLSRRSPSPPRMGREQMPQMIRFQRKEAGRGCISAIRKPLMYVHGCLNVLLSVVLGFRLTDLITIAPA